MESTISKDLSASGGLSNSAEDETLSKTDSGETGAEFKPKRRILEPEERFPIPREYWSQDLIDLYEQKKLVLRKAARPNNAHLLIEGKKLKAQFRMKFRKLREQLLEDNVDLKVLQEKSRVEHEQYCAELEERKRLNHEAYLAKIAREGEPYWDPDDIDTKIRHRNKGPLPTKPPKYQKEKITEEISRNTASKVLDRVFGDGEKPFKNFNGIKSIVNNAAQLEVSASHCSTRSFVDGAFGVNPPYQCENSSNHQNDDVNILDKITLPIKVAGPTTRKENHLYSGSVKHPYDSLGGPIEPDNQIVKSQARFIPMRQKRSSFMKAEKQFCKDSDIKFSKSTMSKLFDPFANYAPGEVSNYLQQAKSQPFSYQSNFTHQPPSGMSSNPEDNMYTDQKSIGSKERALERRRMERYLEKVKYRSPYRYYNELYIRPPAYDPFGSELPPVMLGNEEDNKYWIDLE